LNLLDSTLRVSVHEPARSISGVGAFAAVLLSAGVPDDAWWEALAAIGVAGVGAAADGVVAAVADLTGARGVVTGPAVEGS
jgi:hypothetical protein